MRFRSLTIASALALLLTLPTHAADPDSGTINDSQHATEWSGMFLTPNPGGSLLPVICEEGTPTCDVYRFEVNLSNVDLDEDFIVVEIQSPTEQMDLDIYIYDEETGRLVGSGTTSTSHEIVTIPAANGRYRAEVIPWLAVAESYTGSVRYVPFENDKSLFGFVGALAPGFLAVLAGIAIFRRRRAG
jgi:hypothetical protein